MDYFDFTDFAKKAKAASEYKRNNFYTNYYNHPVDEYDYTKEVIEVEDWEGLKGKMTWVDFARFLNTDIRTLKLNVIKHVRGEGMSKPLIKRFQKYFKKIHINSEDLGNED